MASEEKSEMLEDDGAEFKDVKMATIEEQAMAAACIWACAIVGHNLIYLYPFSL